VQRLVVGQQLSQLLLRKQLALLEVEDALTTGLEGLSPLRGRLALRRSPLRGRLALRRSPLPGRLALRRSPLPGRLALRRSPLPGRLALRRSPLGL
jgi:hypothetical protein